MSYQITLMSLSSPPELGAAQAWPMSQEPGKTNLSLHTPDFFLYPISRSPWREPSGSSPPSLSCRRFAGGRPHRLKASVQQIFACPLQ